MMGIGEARQ